MAEPTHLNWLDASLISVGLFAFIMGVVHGLLWQAARLGGAVLALVVSTKFYKPLAEWLVRHDMASREVSDLAGYAILFCVVFGIVILITAGFDKMIKKANLKPMDRFLGGVAGLVKLMLIFGFVLWAIKRNHVAPLEESVDRSLLGPKLVWAMELAAGKIPPSYREKVDKALPGILPPKTTTPPPSGDADPSHPAGGGTAGGSEEDGD